MDALDLQTLWETLQGYLLDKGLDLVAAVALVLVVLVVGKWIRGSIRKAVTRSRIDDTLASFLSGLGYAVVLVLGAVAALQLLGVPMTPAVAVIGAAGLAVALAFQGTLSNFASGVMLLTFRPFRLDDFVDIAGTSGRVTEVGIFFTILTTPDNVRITIPNSQIFGETIKNVTANATRRIDLVVGVGYDDDLGVAIDTIRTVISEDDRVLDEPEPQVAVSEMGDSSVNLVVRPWVNTEDYWATRFDLTRALKERLEAAGCSIPYPQRDVHLFTENGEGDGAV